MLGENHRSSARALVIAGLCACSAPVPSSGLEVQPSDPPVTPSPASTPAEPAVDGASPVMPGATLTPGAAESTPASGTAASMPGAPTSVPSATPATSAPTTPGDQLFAEGQLLEVRLTLTDADRLELDEHGDREEYVPAQVRLTGAGQAPLDLPEIGMRHKGNWTLHHCWDDFGGERSYDDDCAKLSIKLAFDQYDDTARFDGLKHLNLHAASGDASKMRELLAYRTFREFGVVAPRAIPARVYVNDEPRGLFIAVEDVDGRFTKAHYPGAGDGNLYKEIWPNTTYEDEEFSLALETNEESADVSDMRAFAEAIASSGPDDFAAALEAYVDVDTLLRYVAVDRALRNWDGITSFYEPRTPHNFYWYHDDGPDPRFHLIPWDLDDAYWPFDPYTHPEPPVTAPPIPDLNVRPAHCEPRPIWAADGSSGYVTPGRCDALLDGVVNAHWQTITELGRELLAGPFTAATQSALVDAWAARVAPIVAEDPTLDASAWERSVTEFHDVIENCGSGFETFLDEGLLAEPTGDAVED